MLIILNIRNIYTILFITMQYFFVNFFEKFFLSSLRPPSRSLIFMEAESFNIRFRGQATE